MAFDESLADRVRAVLAGTDGEVREQKMFGGLSFMVNGSFACGVNAHDFLVRVGVERSAEALKRPGARPMDFTGRPLKGWVYVASEALEDDATLRDWVEMGLVAAAQAKPSSLKARKGSQAAAVHPRNRSAGGQRRRGSAPRS